MTTEQTKIFSKLLDVNWDATKESDLIKKLELYNQVNKLENELKASMGDEAYNEYMSNGKKMFAPKV